MPTPKEVPQTPRRLVSLLANLGSRSAVARVVVGECELIGDDLGGVAVHVAARVGSSAQPREVLVSGTVKDLVMGSGIDLVDRGTHDLKGVPGEWRLFAVQTDGEEAPPSVARTIGSVEPPGLADRAGRRLARSLPGVVRAATRALRRRSAA